MSTIGDNIKKIRTSRGMDQSDLAQLLNISPKTISSWEVGRTEPKIGKIELICAALKCKKTDIIEPIVFDVSPTVNSINRILDENHPIFDELPSDEALDIAYAFDKADATTKEIVRLSLKKYFES